LQKQSLCKQLPVFHGSALSRDTTQAPAADVARLLTDNSLSMRADNNHQERAGSQDIFLLNSGIGVVRVRSIRHSGSLARFLRE